MKMFVMQRTLSFEFISVSSWISFHLVVKILSRPNPPRQEEICPIVISCFSPMLLLCHKNVQLESSPPLTFSGSA